MDEDKPVYTEAQVNDMLEKQAQNKRIGDLETQHGIVLEKFVAHMTGEEKNMEEIKGMISKSDGDRRKCEHELRGEIQAVDKKHDGKHDLNVKKSELKLYAGIIIITSGIVAGVVQYIGVKNSPSTNGIVSEVVKQLSPLIEKGVK